MFLVFNKEKIYSYIIVLSTVVVLFGLSAFFISPKNEETIETATSVQKELPIYSVETTENKIALTMNCAW